VQGTNVLPPFGEDDSPGPNDAVVLAPLLGRPYGMVISHGMNPVLNTLKYFREEYLAHIKDNSCPAGVCQLDQIPLLKLPEHEEELAIFREEN
jgi:hypothetical protein